MEKIILILKGFIIGTANIIPGVSGGTIMMSLGIYENILNSINNFFNNVKKNLMYIIYILLGSGLSVLIMSRLITFSIEYYKEPTILFFIGLIVGSYPMLIKNIKSIKMKKSYVITFIIPFLFVIMMSFYSAGDNMIEFNVMNIFDYIKLFIVGIVAASSMIIPGLSGSLILILLGYYEPIMSVIKDFTSFDNIISNGIIIFIFGMGIIVGLLSVIKLIQYLLNKYKVGTYYAILGFVSASIISILITNFSMGINITVTTIISSLILFIFGMYSSYKLGD